MAFTYADYHALVQALLAHPEWRAELRPLILGEELLTLPDWGRRVDERLDRLADTVAALAEAQHRTDQRLDRLTERLDRLTETVADLVAAQERTENQIAALAGAVDVISGRVSRLEGSDLEGKYHRQLGTYVGDILRRPRAITPYDLEPLLDAVDAGSVSAVEFRRMRDLDLLVEGKARGTGEDLLLACEISYTVNLDDVDRAELAAATLRRLGYAARPFVAGYRMRDNARRRAEEVGAALFLHRPPSVEAGAVD